MKLTPLSELIWVLVVAAPPGDTPFQGQFASQEDCQQELVYVEPFYRSTRPLCVPLTRKEARAMKYGPSAGRR